MLFLRGFLATLLAAAPLAAIAQSAPADRGDGWTVAAPEAASVDPAPLAGLPAAIGGGDYPKTTSVLIVRNGKLAYEGYFGAGGPAVLNDTRSAMKSITALALGVAMGEGRIPSEQAPAFVFLGALRPFANDSPTKEAITLQDLLTMSSALDCNDDDDASPGNEDKMHPQPNWTRWAVDLPTMAGYARDASGLGPWRYCTTGAFLLGQIVQRATGTRVDSYVDATLLQPLGVSRRQWPYSLAGEVMTGGGLRLSSRDLAKLAWMVTDGGRWQGRQVVPAAWIKAMLTARRDAYPGFRYGYLYWSTTYKTRCGEVTGWYMSGNGGNAIVSLPDLHAAVVVTRTNYNTRGMHQQTIDLLQTYVLPALMCKA